MRALSLTIVIVLALLLSCTPTWSPPRIPANESPSKVFVCLDLPAPRVQAAAAAVELWDKSLSQWKHVVAVPGHVEPCTIWVHEVTEAYMDDEKAIAWVSTIGGHEISMRRGRYEHDVTGILLHELGHAFGAQHVPNTLMHPNWYPHAYVCPDATTVAQVAAWNKVNLSMLSWCSP